MLTRYLFLAALVGVLPSQERVSAVAPIVAFGFGCASDAAPRVLNSRAELVELLDGMGWRGEVPELDWRKRVVQFLPLGEGHGGNIGVTQVARGKATVVRIEGDAEAAIVSDRWVVVSHDHRKSAKVLFETDARPRSGRATYRTLVIGHDTPRKEFGQLLLPMILRGVEPPDSRRLFVDSLAFADFCLEHKLAVDGASLEPFPSYIDFDKLVVLVRPMNPQPQRADSAQALEFFFTKAGALVRPYNYVGTTSNGGDKAADSQRLYAIYFLPRITGRVDYELPVAGRRGEFGRVARFRIEEPANRPKMPVLRFIHKDVEEREQALCKLATTPSEWRELRKELDEFSDLPDDWCDFTTASVVAIVTGSGPVWPGFRLSVTEEEGVDVLTATQTGPSGVHPGFHSYCLLAVVPRRESQLAVVLRLECGPGPASEQTLRVFPGAGR